MFACHSLFAFGVMFLFCLFLCVSARNKSCCPITLHPSGWIGGTKSPYIEHLYGIGTSKDTSNFTMETLKYGMEQLSAAREAGFLVPLIYGTKEHYLDTHKALQLSNMMSKKQFILQHNDTEEGCDWDALYAEYKEKFRKKVEQKKQEAQAAIDAKAQEIKDLQELIEEFQIWINFVLVGNRYVALFTYCLFCYCMCFCVCLFAFACMRRVQNKHKTTKKPQYAGIYATRKYYPP